MRTNTKLLPPSVKIFEKKQGFLESGFWHGIVSEWSLACSNHHRNYTGSIPDDSPVILRPIRASSARWPLFTAILSDRHGLRLGEAEAAKSLKKLQKLMQTMNMMEILILNLNFVFP